MYRIKKTTELLSVFLIILVLLSACGGSFGSNFTTLNITSSKSFENMGKDSHVYDKLKAEKIASSDAAELYFHKKSGGIAVKSLSTLKEWASLPLFKNTFASSFVATVWYDGKLYELDSSSCAAENGNVKLEKTKNGAVITYTMKADGLSLSLPVKLTLSGAYLDVSCDISACELTEGAVLVSLQLLPFLGSVRYSDEKVNYSAFGDYYVLPDASGAVLHTAVEDENTSFIFSVYGKDYYEDAIPAYVGAYGIKQENSALSVTVTKGAENALIRVFRAGADDKKINRIYPEFIITPISDNLGNVNAAKSYDGVISVSYGLLSSKDADYIDIATSVRQALINAGMLSSVKCENEYPFTVSLIMNTDGKNKNVTSTFQQAENLLSILKGKGINEVNMVLSGMFGNGLQSSAEDNLKLHSALGSKKDISELLSYASSQKLKVFAEINLISSAASVYSLKGINEEYKIVEYTNPLSPYVGEEFYSLKNISSEGIDKATNNILSFVDKMNFAGISIADTGNSCYEAPSDEDGLYTGYDNVLNRNLSAVSSDVSLMLSGAGMNIIRNADYLSKVNLGTNIMASGAYYSVPFVPALIHGSVLYSGNSVNENSVTVIELLKSIEYGAVPSYTWVSDSRSDKYYENGLSDAVTFYLDARNDFSDLASKRITEHFMYEDGVYCTGYEGGVRIYVNYNNYSVIIGEVSVMPYDYLRIG